MIIGTVNERKVVWNEVNKTIRVYGTDILIIGATTNTEAIEISKRNLKNFKAR